MSIEYKIDWEAGLDETGAPIAKLASEVKSEATNLPEAKATKSPRSKKNSAPKAVSTKNKTKTKAVSTKNKTKKLPKFVSSWKEIRAEILAGDKLKDIAAKHNVRYYDVYRVKVHGLTLDV